MLKISKGMEVDDIILAFGDSLISAFPNNVTCHKVTKKVNLQSFRKACFLEDAKIAVSVDGVKVTQANLLQVWCFATGTDITTSCLTRSDKISPLLVAIADYLSACYPDFKWESDKPQSKSVERVSLDALFA